MKTDFKRTTLNIYKGTAISYDKSGYRRGTLIMEIKMIDQSESIRNDIKFIKIKQSGTIYNLDKEELQIADDEKNYF